MKNIPKYGDKVLIDDSIKTEFTEQIEQHYLNTNLKKKEKFTIVNIVVCYNLTKITALMNERADIIDKMRHLQINDLDEFQGKNMGVYTTELSDIKEVIAAKKQEYHDNSNKQNNQDFTGHAFITFTTENGLSLSSSIHNNLI